MPLLSPNPNLVTLKHHLTLLGWRYRRRQCGTETSSDQGCRAGHDDEEEKISGRTTVLLTHSCCVFHVVYPLQVVAAELMQFQRVLQHQGFKSNPLGTINDHLRTTVAVRNQAAEARQAS